jgi:hypothetical protein
MILFEPCSKQMNLWTSLQKDDKKIVTKFASFHFAAHEIYITYLHKAPKEGPV